MFLSITLPGVGPLLLVINGAERLQWQGLLLLSFMQHAKRSYAADQSDVIGEVHNTTILPNEFPSSCRYKKSTKYWRHETCFITHLLAVWRVAGVNGIPPPHTLNFGTMSNVVFCQQTWLLEQARVSSSEQEPWSGNEFWLPCLPECNARLKLQFLHYSCTELIDLTFSQGCLVRDVTPTDANVRRILVVLILKV